MSSDLGLLILRLAVAVIFIYHALPKLKNSKMMAQGMGMSASFVLGLGLVEFLSSVGLIVGAYTKLANILLATVMVGAIYFKMAKWKVPFYASDKMGWEFDFILLTANLALFSLGAGALILWK